MSTNELDRYWSGELSLDELSPELRAEEERIQSLLGAVQADHRARPGLRAAVLRELEVRSAPWWSRILDWMVQPRTVRIRPAVAGLAAAAVAALILVLPGDDPAVSAGGEPASEEVVTRFVFIAPGASSVRITGDFVDWSPDGIALQEERATGVWTVDVPLEPGVYQYGFVIDGEEWRPDPRAVSNVDDGFGRENSVVIVSEESAT